MPESISKRRIPKLNQSTELLYILFCIISGAMYSSVPQKVSVLRKVSIDLLVGVDAIPFFWGCYTLLRPKSVMRRYPSESIRMFSGFRSR